MRSCCKTSVRVVNRSPGDSRYIAVQNKTYWVHHIKDEDSCLSNFEMTKTPHNSPHRPAVGLLCKFPSTNWEWHIDTRMSWECLTLSAIRLFVQKRTQATKKKSNSSLLALCNRIPTVTGRFLTQRASNAESLSMSCRHHTQAVHVT